MRHFHPYWGAALPLMRTLRFALVAAAVGVCAAAVVGQSIFDTVVFNKSAAQTETAKSQSFSAEPKAVSTIIVRTEPVRSPVQATSSGRLTEINELKIKIWKAEVAQRNFAAGLPHCGELNGTNFYSSEQNRVVNLQDYRRSLDSLVTQGAFPWNGDAAWAQKQEQATTDQANCTAVASLPSLQQKLKELQQRQ